MKKLRGDVPERKLVATDNYLYAYGTLLVDQETGVEQTMARIYKGTIDEEKEEISFEDLTALADGVFKTKYIEHIGIAGFSDRAVFVGCVNEGSDTRFLTDSAEELTEYNRTSSYHSPLYTTAASSDGWLYVFGTNLAENDSAYFRATQIETAPIQPDQISYQCAQGDGSVWVKGSGLSLDFTFTRSIENDLAFSHFTGITVDGKTVAQTDYSAESGSVIIKLKPEYLETLSVGSHTLNALFDDGEGSAVRFSISEKGVAPTDKNDDPKTGDSNHSILWLMLMLASAAVLAGIGIWRGKKKKS